MSQTLPDMLDFGGQLPAKDREPCIFQRLHVHEEPFLELWNGKRVEPAGHIFERMKHLDGSEIMASKSSLGIISLGISWPSYTTG